MEGRRDAADVQENGENKKQHEVKKEQDEKKEEDINNNNNKDDQYSSSSSPRGVLETPPLGSSDSDNSSISSSDDRSSNFASSPSGELSQGVYWKNIFDQIKRRSMRRLSSIPLLGYEMILPKNIRRILSKNRSAEEEANDPDDIPKPSWRNFSYGELVEATDNFSPGSEERLDWDIRYKVAAGIAEGLLYLHCECPKRIIHRDITASNILLTEDYEPQISDFGLAKWLPEKWVHHVVSPIEGTFGYMAPEYFMHGIVNEKTDVFAFGVLLLELITGHRAVDSYRKSLVLWAKPLLQKNNIKEIADPRLGDDYDVVEMKRAMFTALCCLHHLPDIRPNMKKVVQLLRGENAPVEMKQKSMGGRALMLSDEYTSTHYLQDLNRHMELVME
uniref:non-specific serine/threonine protein kinase n=1 Tax=Solanum tuberosum TaxID=4113 RepID=M1C653_SOLTU